MKETKYTAGQTHDELTGFIPGPWIAEHSGTGDAKVVSVCGWKNKDGTTYKPTIVGRLDWPTAQLIASAPSLLAANERLREALRECMTDAGANCFRGDNPVEEINGLTRRIRGINETARAALALAESVGAK